jgi:hypothetical protein
MRCEVGAVWLVRKNLKGHACDLLQATMLHLLQHSKDILSTASKNVRFKSVFSAVSKDSNFVL